MTDGFAVTVLERGYYMIDAYGTVDSPLRSDNCTDGCIMAVMAGIKIDQLCFFFI